MEKKENYKYHELNKVIMLSGNIIIAFFVMQYGLFFLSILNKDTHTRVIVKNERIEELRQKEIKTVEEQSEFVRLKYNHKTEKTKFNFWNFLKGLLIGSALFLGPLFGLNATPFRPNFFLTLFISILFVALLNQVLRRYGLQRQDGIDTLFR